MPATSSLDASRNLTLFTVEGDLTFDEQMAVLRDFYEGTPTANVIWDFRAMEGTRISAAQLREIIAFIKRHEGKRPRGKTALVSATDLDFGLSRMGQAYAEGDRLPWEMRAFRSMEEAIHWIQGRETEGTDRGS